MKLTIPELSLVVLIGASGSGKSTFARTHFRATEILSSDACRGLVSDDENNQAATSDAFAVLHFIAAKRLAAGRLTVVDATNVQSTARQPLVALAREYHAIPVAIVLDVPEKECERRNRERPDRSFGSHVIRRQSQDLRRSLRGLEREGFRNVYVLSSASEIDGASIERQRLWTNRPDDRGPFDIIGDVHGCFEELTELLARLGYQVMQKIDEAGAPGYVVEPPGGRTAIFLGDLVDRGPRTPDVIRLVRGMVEAGTALCVPGNHDLKLLRAMSGRTVELTHGLSETMEQLALETPEFRQTTARFLTGLISHYVLDDGKLVVAHAGMKETMQGRASARVRDFALYGETTGETDELGLPVRLNWAADYRGKARVIYGHSPVATPEWLNQTINIDTGCVFGGALTALRYPELELVSVPAAREYTVSPRPLRLPEPASPILSAQQEHDDLLDLEDVMGKRIIATRLMPKVTIPEGNAATALEVISRFAANPKWLIYLPPTMSPSETSEREGFLEHPAEALAYYQKEGIEQVVCEQKHMGSRAVVIVCRDEAVATRRFGVVGEGFGICYTRTGRRFFEDPVLEQNLLTRVRSAIEISGLWDELQTDWVCLDCELMPWSVKAQQLIRDQYAAVGAAAHLGLTALVESLTEPAEDNPDAARLREQAVARRDLADRFVDAYRRYCWPVSSVGDLKLAPFHLLASEGAVQVDRDHSWHLATIGRIARADPELIIATPHLVVELADETQRDAAIHWWEELTESGGEGMVVKPKSFIAKGHRGVVQPAVKCRGREYLRIIYGPEYTQPEYLTRLRTRRLGGKRGLAAREFALGVEALERFVRAEPLRRVHECIFGVLALESEPVDPRL